jgi:hypothetical protein
LKCHGDLQTVDLNLWKETRIAYPYDKATGYKEGDLRGMFVVNAAYPEGLEVARALAEGVSMAELKAAEEAEMADDPADTLTQDSAAGTSD